LSGRDARLVLPGGPAFLQFGDFGELGERRGRQVRQAEKDGLDAGETEIAGLDRRRGAAQTAVKAMNDVFGLRAIGRAENPPQSLWRPNLRASSSRRIGADAHELGRAERDARLVTGESASAARGESIHPDQRKIHQQTFTPAKS